MARQRRTDNKGRRLKEGEYYRNDGRYSYRYTDKQTGKRTGFYASTLLELREKEKKLQRDLEDRLLTDSVIRQMTVNTLFDRYMATKKLKESTRENYLATWNNHVKNDLGLMKVLQVRPSHIKLFYSNMSKAGYSRSMITLVHNLLYPAFEMAVDDDMIRKNPAKKGVSDYGIPPVARKALTPSQQERLLAYTKKSTIYNVYYPVLIIMIGTGMRVGELIGLTWKDVNMRKREIHVTTQLIYKNYGDGFKFHESKPKTDAGIRTIPMSNDVYQAFVEQKKMNFLRGIRGDYQIGERADFIFVAKTGRPLMPAAINAFLDHIVKAFNKEEEAAAVRENREPDLMPHISAHTLRHTGCTRMAEQGLDMKVVQYLMGHANIDVTMQVYNHITEQNRVRKEVAKLTTWKVV